MGFRNELFRADKHGMGFFFTPLQLKPSYYLCVEEANGYMRCRRTTYFG